MDKAAAQKLVRETLQGSFNKERFVSLIKNLLNHVEEASFTYKGNFIFDDFADAIRLVERAGKYQGPDERLIDILVVHLQKDTSPERARTKQRNFVAKYLKGSRGGVLKDAALVAFVAPDGEDWRFSLVKMEYTFDERGKVQEEFTPARRSSFLVGKHETSHTAQSRLLPLLSDDEGQPTLQALENAFSVEKATKEFFDHYRDLFLRLKEALDTIVGKEPEIEAEFEHKHVSRVDFAKKLLGQIVFLYFLQKKGWFGVKRGEPWGSGSKHFLRELYEKRHGEYNNFFNDVLEPLFYEALRLERPGDYYSRFDCRIPFLNGGLFDPLNDYDWIETEILLPDDLFSNDRRTKEGDAGDGILDVFDRYNFTVKEDEPLEKEVAVDPEMLGKVFENLLDVTDRKSKGTYYTPREIVHYMCQESLTNHLATELNDRVSKTDIETLMKHGESVVEHESRVVNEGRETGRYAFKLPERIRANAPLIDEKLAHVRTCDPAVGSGAFVVGMMNETVRIRNALTPHIGDTGARSPYHFKRHAIQHCLYGVDLDSGAVEIAKLRLWLSLIVDEEQRESIQPLPNLDYKMIQGNSLLGVKKDLLNFPLFNQLEALKPLYFNETNVGKKQEYKKQIDDIIRQITNGHKDFDFEVYFSEVFHEEKGFDVVIGNPPYIQLQKNAGELGRIYKNAGFETFSRTGDIYQLFYEKGCRLLTPQRGLLCYITSNSWLKAEYGKSIRRYFSESHTPLSLLEIGANVFDNALVDTNILIVRHGKHDETGKAVDVSRTPDKTFPPATSLWGHLRHQGEKPWNVLSITEQHILNKMQAKGTSLEAWNGISTNYGIKTGLNDAFIIDDKTRQALITEDPASAEIIKPVLRGRDIQRYQAAWAGLYLIDTHNGYGNVPAIKVDDYPAVKNHLDQFYLQLEKRQDKGKTPYNLRSCAYHEEFAKEKLLWPDITDKGCFAFDDDGMWCNDKAFIITGSNLKYLCAVLNSHLIYCLIKQTVTTLGNQRFQWKKFAVERLPIPNISTAKQRPFIRLVDRILSAKAANPSADTTEQEAEIDRLVYQLYNLTEPEIAAVEGTMNANFPT